MVKARAAIIVICVGVVAALGGYLVRFSSLRGSSTGAQASAGVAACHALADGFSTYPLVDVGDDFEGTPLTVCEHRHTNATDYGVPATDQVIFVYGACTPSTDDESSCVPPLQIHVYPGCMPVPLDIAGEGDIQSRGVAASYINGSSLFASAGAYHVKITAAIGDAATNRAAVARAMNALRGANAAASGITSDSQLSQLGQGATTPAPSPCK